MRNSLLEPQCLCLLMYQLLRSLILKWTKKIAQQVKKWKILEKKTAQIWWWAEQWLPCLHTQHRVRLNDSGELVPWGLVLRESKRDFHPLNLIRQIWTSFKVGNGIEWVEGPFKLKMVQNFKSTLMIKMQSLSNIPKDIMDWMELNHLLH